MAIIDLTSLPIDANNWRKFPSKRFNVSSPSTLDVRYVETITVITSSVPAEVTYYKRGYYTLGAQFEYWRTTNPDAGPPSGNPLLDITIIGQVCPQ